MITASLPLKVSRILLVDDEIQLTQLWRMVLEITGRYTVREENHGPQVLETVRKFRPDLIFLDRDLSGTDGGEIAGALRADEELRDIPIVFITGSVTSHEAQLHGVFGGTPTLAKPFGCEVLTRLADTILRRQRRNESAP
jgi:CheY-like chemotaxis protein